MLKLKKLELGRLALVGLVSFGFAVGCAPAQKYSTSAPSNRMASLKSAQTSGNADANWRCPASANVLLVDNIGPTGFDYTGNGNFTACVGRNDSSLFRVTGVTTSSSICIYPLRSSNGSGLTLVEQPRCFTVSGGPIEADFNASDINYFAIVDGNYTQQMTACLSSATPCPSHSEGFVQ